MTRLITAFAALFLFIVTANATETMRLDVDGRPLEGEFLRSATIVNTMIKQLSVFTSEARRRCGT